MNKYLIKARLYPTLITVIPVIIFYYFTLGMKINAMLNYVIAVSLIAHVTISASLVYGLILLNRFIAKALFQKLYFQDEQNMPTTNFLLINNNVLSSDMKKKLTKKINDDFKIKLLNSEEELNDEAEARRQIVFAVSQIRNKTRKNELLLQHNIEYGFIRNLIGGSVVAIIVSCINIYIFYSLHPISLAYKFSIGLLVIYSLVVFFSKAAINSHGKAYAKVLFEQYLSK